MNKKIDQDRILRVGVNLLQINFLILLYKFYKSTYKLFNKYGDMYIFIFLNIEKSN
jgi:hypothetical protein